MSSVPNLPLPYLRTPLPKSAKQKSSFDFFRTQQPNKTAKSEMEQGSEGTAESLAAIRVLPKGLSQTHLRWRWNQTKKLAMQTQIKCPKQILQNMYRFYLGG
jgi:hypothetical protein